MWLRPVSTPINARLRSISAAAVSSEVRPVRSTIASLGRTAAMPAAAARSPGPAQHRHGKTGLRLKAPGKLDPTLGKPVFLRPSRERTNHRHNPPQAAARQSAPRRPRRPRRRNAWPSSKPFVGRSSIWAKCRYSEPMRAPSGPLSTTRVISRPLPSREPSPTRSAAPDRRTGNALFISPCKSTARSKCRRAQVGNARARLAQQHQWMARTPVLAQARIGPFDDLVQIRVMAQQRRALGLHQPSDVRIRPSTAKTGHQRRCEHDVADGTEPNQQDASALGQGPCPVGVARLEAGLDSRIDDRIDSGRRLGGRGPMVASSRTTGDDLLEELQIPPGGGHQAIRLGSASEGLCIGRRLQQVAMDAASASASPTGVSGPRFP